MTRSPLKPQQPAPFPLGVEETPESGSHALRAVSPSWRPRPPSSRPSARSSDRRPSISPRAELVNRFQFVADHQDAFEVKRLSYFVEIKRSSYYAWKAAARGVRLGQLPTPSSPRRSGPSTPTTTPSRRRGRPRSSTTRSPSRSGQPQARRAGDASARHRRLPEEATGQDHGPRPSDQKVPDLLKRDFTAKAHNERYVGDITYLPLADGTNLYLATVINFFSRRLIGWSVADHMHTSLTRTP